jgi:hypothetical protein
MAFGKSTEENYITLQTTYKQCLEWAMGHGASFAQEKYILLHFTKTRTKHSNAWPLILHIFTLTPHPSVHGLGIILDKKLSWKPHLRHVKTKLATLTNVLTRLMASIWGTSPGVSRLLYITVVRWAIITGCFASWAPSTMTLFLKMYGGRAPKYQWQLSQNYLHEPTRPH